MTPEEHLAEARKHVAADHTQEHYLGAIAHATIALSEAVSEIARPASREKLLGSLSNVLCNASNYPAKAVPHILGANMAPLLAKVADALEAEYRMVPRG